MQRQILGSEWAASNGARTAESARIEPPDKCLKSTGPRNARTQQSALRDLGNTPLSLALLAALAIHLLSGTTTALAAETEGASRNKGSGNFAYPVSTANRRFIDQTGKVYLLKTMSSWAMSQNCSEAEITQALEGLKALRFNAVTVSPFGVHMNDSFGDRYRNKAGQSFFSGKPYASTLGPAWSS